MSKEKDLESVMQDFENDKEKVRNIIGKIGGRGKKEKLLDSIVNIIFLVVTIAVFLSSYFIKSIDKLLTIEIGVLLVSFKVLLMVYKQEKVFHFQFWVLSSLEFMLTQIEKRTRKIERLLENEKKDNK